MTSTFTAFAGARRIAAGTLEQVLPTLRRRFQADGGEAVLVFEDSSGAQIDFDLRGTLEEVLARAEQPEVRGPGRPKLGVLSREVSLLPRHWDWLEQQPQGISAALRRLVDQARSSDPGKARARQLRAKVSRFMTAMAGNRPGYEEALRALFRGEQAAFEAIVKKWPKDVRAFVLDASREAARAEASDRAR